MGIADRDYYREESRSAPRGGRMSVMPAKLKGWSGTTWIIVLCSLVFVLDRVGILPLGKAPTGLPELVENADLYRELHRIPRDQLKESVARPVYMIDGQFTDNRGLFEAAARDRQQKHALRSLLAVTKVYVGTNGQSVPVVTTLYDPVPFLQSWLQFTTAQAIMYPSPTRGLEGFEFWRLIGYMFAHANVTHIFLNMLGLFFFGPVVEEYLGRKRFLAFFLLCGIFGALLYMVLNLGGMVAQSMIGHTPAGLLPNSPYSPLIGASAGVYGVIMAGAFLLPDSLVYLFFAIPLRLRTLAIGMIAISVLTVFMNGNNAGGEAAHLGGAAAGWWFIRRPHLLHGFFDFLGHADPTSRSGKLRRARKGGRIADEAELDRLLAKVREHGLQSLSDAERRRLQDISRSL